MRKLPLVLVLSFLTLTSCGTGNVITTVKTPNEEGGLEANAAEDAVDAVDTTKAESFLKSLKNNAYYTYEITLNIPNSETHFMQYYSPNAFFELNDDFDSSIGYASEYLTGDLFKFYLDESMTNITPSTYEYMNNGEQYVKMDELYSAFTIASFSLMKTLEDPDYSVVALSSTKFQIADPNITSIFQYMTSYGSSISGYVISTYFEILDEEAGKFKSTIDLGANGTITGEYTRYTEQNYPLIAVENQIKSGAVKGVDHYDDVYDLFRNKIALNNYTLSGIKVESATGGVTSPTYNVICTENYFYFDYLSSNYTDFGYVFLPKNTAVTCKYDSNGNAKTTKYNLPYSACFEFEKSSTGDISFSRLVGPVEDDYKYLEVTELPSTGASNTLYIKDGVAYQWAEVTSGTYGFKKYTDWLTSVGDFAINGIAASFYLGDVADGMGIFFEKDRKTENRYTTTKEDVLSYLANGLFGWGFQASTTWMEYVRDAFITINKNDGGELVSADIGLGVMASLNGGSYGKQSIFYTVSDFGTSTETSVEAFLASYLGE